MISLIIYKFWFLFSKPSLPKDSDKTEPRKTDSRTPIPGNTDFRTYKSGKTSFPTLPWAYLYMDLPDLVLLDSVIPSSVIPDSVLPESVIPESVLPASVLPASVFWTLPHVAKWNSFHLKKKKVKISLIYNHKFLFSKKF